MRNPKWNGLHYYCICQSNLGNSLQFRHDASVISGPNCLESVRKFLEGRQQAHLQWYPVTDVLNIANSKSPRVSGVENLTRWFLIYCSVSSRYVLVSEPHISLSSLYLAITKCEMCLEFWNIAQPYTQKQCCGVKFIHLVELGNWKRSTTPNAAVPPFLTMPSTKHRLLCPNWLFNGLPYK